MVDCRDMLGSRVALVVPPVVGGKLVRQTAHQSIAVGLGQYGRGGDGEVSGIALYDAAIGNAPLVVESVAIDQNELRFYIELSDSQVHTVDRSAQNVHLVDVRF